MRYPDFVEEIRHCGWKVRALHGRTSVPLPAHGLGVLRVVGRQLVIVGKGVGGIWGNKVL